MMFVLLGSFGFCAQGLQEQCHKELWHAPGFADQVMLFFFELGQSPYLATI